MRSTSSRRFSVASTQRDDDHPREHIERTAQRRGVCACTSVRPRLRPSRWSPTEMTAFMTIFPRAGRGLAGAARGAGEPHSRGYHDAFLRGPSTLRRDTATFPWCRLHEPPDRSLATAVDVRKPSDDCPLVDHASELAGDLDPHVLVYGAQPTSSLSPAENRRH
jgi:hypothetical protein